MTPSRVDARLRSPRPHWVAPTRPDPDLVATLRTGLGLPEIVCSVLAARGVTDVDTAKRFLRPELGHLHDPALLADGERAAARTARAIREGERIFVHGDYDVDGICAAAVAHPLAEVPRRGRRAVRTAQDP